MAKFKFKYGVMGAGKSEELMRIWRSYSKGDENSKDVLVLYPSTDTRTVFGRVESRNGNSIPAKPIPNNGTSHESIRFVEMVYKAVTDGVKCILVDEVQFVEESALTFLKHVTMKHNVPVIVFGLLKDFQNNLFDGSKTAIILAEELHEIETKCAYCSKKAIMNLRLDSEGKPVKFGDQIEVGGDDKYVAVCHKHWENKNV